MSSEPEFVHKTRVDPTGRPLISIAAPAFNEEDNLAAFYAQVADVMARFVEYDFEIVITDNGSTDGSLAVLKRLHAADPRVRFVSLTRNFGHQGGILAALSYCRGHAVVTMDADLQHPPQVIPNLIAEWERGFKIVNSTKAGLQRGVGRRFLDRTFYYAMDRLANLKLGQADFRLLDRHVVDELLALPEADKFLRGLISWMGFPQTTIEYPPASRIHGETKFRRGDLIEFALLGVTSFSSAPLRMLMKLGLSLFVPSALFLVYTIGAVTWNMVRPGGGGLPPGWATLSVTITFFGAVQLLAISVLGEYIGRIYTEVKRRPSFIVRETAEDETPT
jgi:glycosyltransferase involved in cell wall biosynthesis